MRAGRIILVSLAILISSGCISQPQRFAKAPPAEVKERLKTLAKTLPEKSTLKLMLGGEFVGGIRYGDGVRYRWMDDLQQLGVKMVEVEVHFTWFFGPRRMRASRVMYFTSYERIGHQITDPNRLADLKGSRLESDLKGEGVRLAPAASWLDLPGSIFWPFPGQTTVTLYDDEWLPLPHHMYSRIDPDRPPLIQAIFSDDEADVRRLLASGEISKKERDEGLFWACPSYAVGILDLLLKAGANPNTRDDKNLVTPLIVAGRWSNKEGVSMLLKAGANPNLGDADGDTPLMAALGSRDDPSGIVGLLLNSNADVNAANFVGLTPLMRAGQIQKSSVIEILLRRGANINIRDKRGFTALIWAAQYGNATAIPTLLAAHADINAKTISGDTALAVTDSVSHPEIVELLKHAGASQ